MKIMMILMSKKTSIYLSLWREQKRVAVLLTVVVVAQEEVAWLKLLIPT